MQSDIRISDNTSAAQLWKQVMGWALELHIRLNLLFLFWDPIKEQTVYGIARSLGFGDSNEKLFLRFPFIRVSIEQNHIS